MGSVFLEEQPGVEWPEEESSRPRILPGPAMALSAPSTRGHADLGQGQPVSGPQETYCNPLDN